MSKPKVLTKTTMMNCLHNAMSRAERLYEATWVDKKTGNKFSIKIEVDKPLFHYADGSSWNLEERQI